MYKRATNFKNNFEISKIFSFYSIHATTTVRVKSRVLEFSNSLEIIVIRGKCFLIADIAMKHSHQTAVKINTRRSNVMLVRPIAIHTTLQFSCKTDSLSSFMLTCHSVYSSWTVSISSFHIRFSFLSYSDSPSVLHYKILRFILNNISQILRIFLFILLFRISLNFQTLIEARI